MDDKTKVQLCKKLIREFFEYDRGGTLEAWIVFVDALDTILSFGEEQDG